MEQRAKCLSVNFVYTSNALLFRCLNPLMVELSMPLALEVVAAPILKLWPVIPEQFRLAVDNARRTFCTNLTLDREAPSMKMRKGSEQVSLTAMYTKSYDTSKIDIGSLAKGYCL